MTDGQAPAVPADSPPTAGEIREWIVSRLSEKLRVSPEEIRLDEPLIDQGLDSMEFVALVGELERWLGCRFKDNPLIDYPTLNTLSEFLADQLARGRTVIDSVHPE
jgi:acyl carrier protein